MSQIKEKKLHNLEKYCTNSTLFEENILDVYDENDRKEVMEILAQRLVRDKLKKSLNFLYLEDLEDLSLAMIVPVLTKELYDEALEYGRHVLYLGSEETKSVIERHIVSIGALAQEYMSKYKEIIFGAIVDSFIELIYTSSHLNKRAKFIESVLESPLILNRNMLAMHSVEQLHRRIKAAYNRKSLEISKLQMKVAELNDRIAQSKEDEQERTQLYKLLASQEERLAKTTAKTLDHYDATLDRLKTTMVKTLANL